MNVPSTRADEVLAAVHREPGISRAALAGALGLSSGGASDLVAALVARDALSEGEPAPGGGRGRPTRSLWPHPEGPLVAAVAISHETWTVAAAQLGGTLLESDGGDHDRDAAAVLGAAGAALAAISARHGPRLRAIAVSVPGTVSGTVLVQAPYLGWEDLELLALRPADAPALPLLAGNDATWSAIGELRRGVAAGHAGSLHLYMDSGVGGALIDAGRVSEGAHGMAGEFGHLPFGSRRRRCRCGALGCWNTDLDGAAFARALRRSAPAPVEEVSFMRDGLEAAARGERAPLRAAHALAGALGRGAAGLVNAADPEVVVLNGLAARLLAVADGPLRRAYADGLMSTRTVEPPPLLPGALGERAPLVGAVEGAFGVVLGRAAG